MTREEALDLALSALSIMQSDRCVNKEEEKEIDEAMEIVQSIFNRMDSAVEGRMEYNHIVVSYENLAKVFPNGKDGDKVQVVIMNE